MNSTSEKDGDVLSSRKVKVFLGAFINQTNAQNLNCLTLARYLDKSKYVVYALAIKHGNLNTGHLPGVRVFTCFYPVKLTAYLGLLWGIAVADVAYLPRGNFFNWQRFLIRLFRRKSFKTIENVIDEAWLGSAQKVLGSMDNVMLNYAYCTRNYSITQYMRDYNLKRWNLQSEKTILPLLTDTGLFGRIRSVRDRLTGAIFIGNDMARKGVEYFIRLASTSPHLVFHVVGSNTTGIDLAALIKKHNAPNVIIHGLLLHENLLALLKDVQLHVLPSSSEGFPRGIIETAAAGVPTLTFSGYGAEEWIKNDVNGFVADTWDDMRGWMTSLTAEKIEHLSRGAIDLSARFDANSIVKKYEAIIDALYEDR